MGYVLNIKCIASGNVFREKTDLVVLLHTRPNSEVAPFGSSYTDADLSRHLSEQFEDSYKAQSHKVLLQAIKFLKSKNFSVKAISLKGDAREEIARKVQELNVDLLVIGSRGMGMIKRYIILLNTKSIHWKYFRLFNSSCALSSVDL